MLRMPAFELHRPATAEEASRLKKALPRSLYVAGGTDLLPNLKHGLHDADHLVSLLDLHELIGVTHLPDGTVRIGSGTRLQDLADDLRLRDEIPAVVEAVSVIAGPQHRRMGTLGGNVMLDTRCLFYNQSEGWRKALGYCLKREGDWCHVIDSRATCVAAQSSDSVPALISVDARLEILEDGVRREVALETLFEQDGRYDATHTISRDALVTAILVPQPAHGHRGTYRKVRSRAAVDFPQLGLAVAASFENGRCTRIKAVVGAIMPSPKVLKNLDAAVGTALEDPVITALAESCFRQVKPQTQLHGSTAWRRHMARVEMQRALRHLREAGTS